MMKQLIIDTFKYMGETLVGGFLIIAFGLVVIGLPFGSLTGIVYLVDNYGHWWALLLLPWVFFASMLGMLLSQDDDSIGRRYD